MGTEINECTKFKQKYRAVQVNLCAIHSATYEMSSLSRLPAPEERREKNVAHWIEMNKVPQEYGKI